MAFKWNQPLKRKREFAIKGNTESQDKRVSQARVEERSPLTSPGMMSVQ